MEEEGGVKEKERACGGARGESELVREDVLNEEEEERGEVRKDEPKQDEEEDE